METETQVLHRLTSYEPRLEWDAAIDDPRIVQGFETDDLSRFPWFTKRYAHTLPRLTLPRELPGTTASAMAVLAGTADTVERPLDLAYLARILHLSAGVVRTMERPYATWLFRAAGSAGGRFPMEVYVAVPDGISLPAGVHWYDPVEHALVQVGLPPAGNAPTIVVTGVPWRTGWRYRERGYRHIYWDTGTMLSQLLAAADSAGISADLYTGFPDAAITSLVGADGVHEFPVAIVALGIGEPAIAGSSAAAPGAVDAAPMEFPLVTSAQRAGEQNALGAPWDRGAPVEVPDADGRPVERVVLARGSQRLMDASRSLPKGALERSMAVAMRGIAIPHWVAVHAVDGVEPGVYRWPDLTAPIRAGDLRDELFRVSLEQGLARDAAFVVIGGTDVGALNDHGYRDAQLASGLVEGRLHLAAYAQGASASGMTFLDSEIPALLGEPVDGLLFTCVGVPEYASTPGGQPGAPVKVGRIESR